MIKSVSDIQTIPTHYSKVLFDVFMNQKTEHDKEILEKNNVIARLREKLAELEKGNNAILKAYIQCINFRLSSMISTHFRCLMYLTDGISSDYF